MRKNQCTSDYGCLMCEVSGGFSQRLGMSLGCENGKIFNKDSNIVIGENAARGLCLFLKNEGQYLSQQEIRQYVWGGHPVSLSSILQLIYQIRVVLRHSRYELVNIRSKGYGLQLRKKPQELSIAVA